jgi:hypothetical protein
MYTQKTTVKMTGRKYYSIFEILQSSKTSKTIVNIRLAANRVVKCQALYVRSRLWSAVDAKNANNFLLRPGKDTTSAITTKNIVKAESYIFCQRFETVFYK